MNLLKSIKNLIDGAPKQKTEIEAEIIKPEAETVSLTPFEEKLNFLYMGCYNVNPVKQVITQELGNVRNQRDCINIGKSEGYQYVALQGGNECLGANNLDLKDLTSFPRSSCNLVCDESSAGFCGGVLKNQIYATSLPGAVGNEYHENMLNNAVSTTHPQLNSVKPVTSSETSSKTPSENTNNKSPSSENNNKETFRHLEHFVNTNREIKNIEKNIGQIDMLCQKPIDKYNLLLILLIILFLGYLLIEIIYKKNNF
jgi:hypothetical protein